MPQWAKELGLQYFISGVVFWVAQVIVLSLSPWWTSAIAFVNNLLEQLIAVNSDAPAILTAVLALAGLVSVIGVTLTGYILDLLSMRFTRIEISNFKRHLKQNEGWAKRIFEGLNVAHKYDALVSDERNVATLS